METTQTNQWDFIEDPDYLQYNPQRFEPLPQFDTLVEGAEYEIKPYLDHLYHWCYLVVQRWNGTAVKPYVLNKLATEMLQDTDFRDMEIRDAIWRREH